MTSQAESKQSSSKHPIATMGNNVSCVPCSRSEPAAPMQRHEPARAQTQALLTMPDMTIHDLAARVQVAHVPLNMQAQEMVETLAQGAMQAGREPRAEYKDITMQ